ncbi:KTSC domain-containing protein [Sphingomonas gilva]|uniref:KTSC domain-containing protein n=2 Tax=Sphingomonas gilva TaxID=2305907 RepID=A0A396S2W3_9SPHN|nr:KTSC domain-containing protein [Sphingomonas gilva]
MPSTAIRRYDYDADRRRLEIEFITGRRYSYADVPPSVAEAMRRATSKGGFFNRRIRDRYAFERLGG